MSYQYNVFISYSSADRGWAEKLSDALSERGVSSFLDNRRLVAGAQWEPQLVSALEGSQHLVVIWSRKADDSSWVRRELGRFDAMVDMTPPGQSQVRRRLIFVLLEEQNRAYASMQMITGLMKAGVYDPDTPDGGVSNLTPSLWHDVVEQVVGAVRHDDKSIPIPLAVMAMKQEDFARIDPNEEIDGTSLNALLTDFGIETIDGLKDNYGEQRTDWRPFGSPLNIRQILERLRDEINAATKGPQFRWEPIRDEFWTSVEVARQERGKLIANLSLIVIDPISLYFDDLVYKRLVLLSNCFNSESTIIVVLTPFTLPQAIVNLRALIEMKGTPFFDSFFDPPIPNEEAYANCGINIGDDREFKRLLRFSLGQYTRKSQPPSGSEYLSL